MYVRVGIWHDGAGDCRICRCVSAMCWPRHTCRSRGIAGRRRRRERATSRREARGNRCKSRPRQHLALLERAVVVDLVEHLTVGMIEPAGKWRDEMRVGQRLSGNPILGKFRAARVAKAAGLDLLAEHRRRIVTRSIAGFRIDRPGNVAAFIKPNEQTLVAIFDLAKWPPTLLGLCPADVS